MYYFSVIQHIRNLFATRPDLVKKMRYPQRRQRHRCPRGTVGVYFGLSVASQFCFLAFYFFALLHIIISYCFLLLSIAFFCFLTFIALRCLILFLHCFQLLSIAFGMIQEGSCLCQIAFYYFFFAFCCFLKFVIKLSADVQDAEVWKSSKMLRKQWNLGLALNGDGIPIYKSSGYGVFPVFICILNLPPSIRYNVENLFLCCLYPGPKEPKNTNAFFAPLIKELRKLYQYGNCQYCGFGKQKLSILPIIAKIIASYYFYHCIINFSLLLLLIIAGISVKNSFDCSHNHLRGQLLFVTMDLVARRKVCVLFNFHIFHIVFYCFVLLCLRVVS